MNKPSIRVLVLGDSEDDAKLMARLIEKNDYTVYYERINTAQQMKDAITNNMWDVIISDYKMSKFKGIEALEILNEYGLDIPFILVSGKIDEKAAVETMRKGVVDYLMKNNLLRLVPAIERELKDRNNRADQKKDKDKLQQSGEKFKIFFEKNPDYSYIVSSNGIFLDVNESALKALGYEKNELLGKSISTIYAPESQSKMKVIFEKWKKTGHLNNEEMTIITKNGERRTVLLSTESLKEGKKVLFNSISVQRDITDRKNAELDLIQNEKKYRTLFEDSINPIWTTTREGIVIDTNRAAAELLGYSKEELIGSSVYRLYVDPDRRKQLIAEIEEKGFVKDFQVQWKTKDGRQVDLLFNFTLWKDNDGNVMGYRGIAHDMTLHYRSEKQLGENLEYFAHLIDHIRNPLAILSAFVQVKVDDEKIKDVVIRQVDRIEKLLKELDEGWMDTEDTRKFLKKYM